MGTSGLIECQEYVRYVIRKRWPSRIRNTAWKNRGVICSPWRHQLIASKFRCIQKYTSSTRKFAEKNSSEQKKHPFFIDETQTTQHFPQINVIYTPQCSADLGLFNWHHPFHRMTGMPLSWTAIWYWLTISRVFIVFSLFGRDPQQLLALHLLKRIAHCNSIQVKQLSE